MGYNIFDEYEEAEYILRLEEEEEEEEEERLKKEKEDRELRNYREYLYSTSYISYLEEEYYNSESEIPRYKLYFQGKLKDYPKIITKEDIEELNRLYQKFMSGGKLSSEEETYMELGYDSVLEYLKNIKK